MSGPPSAIQVDIENDSSEDVSSELNESSSNSHCGCSYHCMHEEESHNTYYSRCLMQKPQ